MQPVLHETLRTFGLTENETRAYEALLRYGRQTPAELAPRAGVSRGRVYQVLNEMGRKGLVTEVAVSPRSFIAVDPEVALSGLLAERRAELEETEGLIDVVVSSLESLKPETPSSAPAIEVLTRPEQISQHYQKELADAEHEVLSFSKAPYVDTGINHGELAALARGVRYAAIYERTFFENAVFVKELARYIIAGEEPRVLDSVPMKLVIFDRRKALMPLTTSSDPAQRFTSVVVHDQGLAETLALAHDHAWAQASPVSTASD